MNQDPTHPSVGRDGESRMSHRHWSPLCRERGSPPSGNAEKRLEQLRPRWGAQADGKGVSRVDKPPADGSSDSTLSPGLEEPRGETHTDLGDSVEPGAFQIPV